jgi:hypothetical protein
LPFGSSAPLEPPPQAISITRTIPRIPRGYH